MRNLPISQVVNKGIQQLFSLQQENGSFVSLSSSNEHDFSNAKIYHTTFLSSFILSVTAKLPSTRELIFIRKKLARFLQTQRSAYWSWNYWERKSQEATESPYPDDLDDTFCALTALTLYDNKIITGGVFAHIVKILTLTEEKEGGPYRTWLVKRNAPKVWRDVDFAVNANIAYFLSLHDITLPNLQKYFDSAIKRKKMTSPYYPSLHAPLYFISRFYTGNNKEVIKDILLEKKGKNGIWDNPLKTALVITALIHLGVESKKLEKSIKYLLDTNKNGLWSAYGFCIDPSKNGTRYFGGSAALTTVFCLEALQKYESVIQKQNKQRTKREENTEKLFYYNNIIENVTKHFHTYGEEIYSNGELLLQRILKYDTSQQIPLLPYYFFKSLNKENKKVTQNILIKLGAANVMGWMAYTIYDDFFDGEGEASLLPLALVCSRQLTYMYDTFTVKKKRIQKNFHTILNRIDKANAKELKARVLQNSLSAQKNFDQLAEKSIGHALGPLTILLLLGYTQTSKEFKNVLSFFTHYLVAKQLNDDAHDWERDFKKGQITPVITLILKRAQEKKLNRRLRTLQKIFWTEIIQEVSMLIQKYAQRAKLSLKKSMIIANPEMLEKLVDAQIRSATQALEEQKNVTSFIKTYRG